MFNIISCVLFLSLWVCSSTDVSASIPPEKLILNMPNTKVIPRNFRTAQTPYLPHHMLDSDFLPSRIGLDALPISGSAQFSIGGLEAILETIKQEKIIIIDLRQESHGFVNDHAASRYAPRNWGNVGLSPREIEEDQTNWLEGLKAAGIATIYKDKNEEVPILMDIKKVETECSVVARHQLEYKRFYVTDHLHPSNEVVDEFVQFVLQLPKDVWLHFHCAAGKGRTTTFMTMYDMMHNAHELPFEEILIRQWLIGGLKLDKDFCEKEWKLEFTVERVEFLKQFYEYCKQNPHFEQSWSEYSSNSEAGSAYAAMKLARQSKK